MKNKTILITGLLSLLFTAPAFAEDGGDLALEKGSIRAKDAVIVGKTVRIYATVKNNSPVDLLGTVKFFDETKGAFIGDDQPVSAVANGTDEVFVDWEADSVGEKTITARVIPWVDVGDDPKNNKITATIYVDEDSDGDGKPNRQDPDDDNDATNDDQDAFPLDAAETKDSDNDGVGNNADEDDDNDSAPDLMDAFPEDSKETQDQDGDGVGDNADAFPKDPKETVDEDKDGLGANVDPDDHNLGPAPKIDLKDSVAMIGSSIEFDASGTKDPDGQVAGYSWDFGDGSKGKGVQVKKKYEKAGNYKVTLRATDDKGEYRTTAITMTIIHRWQSIPFLIGVGIVLAGLVGYMVYHFKFKKGKRKKTLPGMQK